jgi:hypothetical protein
VLVVQQVQLAALFLAQTAQTLFLGQLLLLAAVGERKQGQEAQTHLLAGLAVVVVVQIVASHPLPHQEQQIKVLQEGTGLLTRIMVTLGVVVVLALWGLTLQQIVVETAVLVLLAR